MAAIAVAALGGCRAGAPPPTSLQAAPQPLDQANRLVGFWRSQPFLTQLGCARAELCLTPDGSFTFVFRSQGAAFVALGTYTVATGSLLLQTKDSAPEKYEVREGALVRTDKDGRQIVFTVVDSNCKPPDESPLTPTEEEEKACFD
jgi:hypothetical protein